ncbi:MAG: hypothetical protein KJZ75_11090 [Hyphomonadaceae bacterium]|nr:hypothetical protein [Hyphomonadaceae bacterium]
MTPAPQRAPVNWRARIEGVIDGALKYWWVILGAIAILFVLSSCDVRWPWSAPSGREVAAEANQRTAESNQRTAEAETRRAQDSVVIVEDTHRARARVRTQTEEAREAVADAPDLEASYREYRDRAQRLRDESRAAYAAAVQQHTAELDP